jgi:ribosomal RNA assembly protein
MGPRRPSKRRLSEADMLYARIPAERLGVLIGPDGATKRRLQESTGTKVVVDSTTGEVTIDEAGAADPVLALKARDIVQAMARGFSEERAFRLLDDDVYLEVLDIKDFARSKNRVAQVRARIIGTRGKTRRIIEELTAVDVSVWGHTVAMIGGSFEMAIARDAVIMLLRGSEHKTVYRFLERKRADLKVYQMGF